MGWGVKVLTPPVPVRAPVGYRNSVTVGGWTCYDGPTPPPDAMGSVWVLETLTGWFGGVDVRGNPVDRPMLDGAFDGDAPLAGRTVEISGNVVATDRGALQQELDKLSAVLSGRQRRGQLVVDELVVPVTRTALVRLGGPTMIQRTGPVSASFSLSLYAPDPTRYGTTPHSVVMGRYQAAAGRTYDLVFDRVYPAGGNTGYRDILNLGNTGTAPVVTFNGPCVNPNLQAVGGTMLRLLMTINSGQSVVVDCQARTVTLLDASRRQYLSADSQWITLPPGPSSLYYTNDSGAGTCTVAWLDAWS